MSKKSFAGRFYPLVALLFFCVQMRAADYYVGVDGSGFSPASLTIEAGDTVTWVNNDNEDFPHTTTSDLDILNANYWNGLLSSQGDTFSFTFNTVGTFSYHDQIDIGTGTIIVNPASVTPAITLESPRMAGGQFLFEATGLTPGSTIVLLASTNLTTWTAIQTNLTAASSLTFTNAVNPASHFFQVVQQP